MDTSVQQTLSVNTLSVNTLSVNGDIRTFDASLATILCDFGVDISQTRGVAVAVNDEVIRKKEWSTFILSPDDRVEIVTARQGG